MISGITFSFLLMAAAVLWFVIGSKGYVLLKSVMIVICCAAAIIVFNTLNSYRGWPSTDDTPIKFMIKWVDVHEPHDQYEGDIFIWISKPPKYALTDKDVEQKNILYYYGKDHEPRAFRLPYSKNMHKIMQDVKQAIRGGFPVIVDRSGEASGKDKEANGKSKFKGPKGQSDNKGEKTGTWNFSGKQEWQFHILPPPKLPDKVND